MTRLREVLEELAAWGSARDWIGPDPYEGLNAPIAKLLGWSRRGRQAATQVNRRSPVALPWPFRASPRANAKVAGLVLSAYSQPAGADLPRASQFVDEMARRLEQLRLAPSGAWGYPFDVQTRSLGYTQSTPNAIATCFAIRGLLDAADAGMLDRGYALAAEARPFLSSLMRTSEHGRFFAYVAAGSELIHNANLMVCGTIARLLEAEPDEALAERVETALETTLRLRRDDGGWPYGERPDLDWRDNFHTAYVLEGLARVAARSGRNRELLVDATDRWFDAFVTPDATATYHPRRSFPADTHSAASAIDTLCVVGDVVPAESERLRQRAIAIAERAVDLLWLPGESRFAVQVNRRSTNRREFMRWTNAPMFEALSRTLSEPARAP